MLAIDNYNFSGKKALIRVDYNVPLNKELKITDDTRIKATLQTINKVTEGGGAVILMSHLGRPEGGYEDKYSLKHLVNHLSNLLNKAVIFATDCVGDDAKTKASALQAGEILLIENLRFHKEETKGDEAFSQKLAALGDVYINDAFGTAHRAHASTAVIAKFFPNDKLFGYCMGGEVEGIKKVMEKTQKPFTAIIGGAKVSSKIGVLENLLAKSDSIIIGGGMAFTFIKALGGKVGNSLVEEDLLQTALDIVKRAEQMGVKIVLPADCIIADSFSNDAQQLHSDIYTIPDGWMGLDVGPKTIEMYTTVILASKTILWNGPVGVFEFENFSEGTKQLGMAIAKATSMGAYSLVGGGDSVTAAKQFELEDKLSYISTGGGALLEYIEGKILPGVAAIEG